MEQAIARRDVDDVVGLLAAGAPVNHVDSFSKQTCLHLAILLGFDDMVSVLLDGGANPNHGKHNGMTALVSAIMRSRSVVSISKLICAGADVNGRCDGGGTALMVAAIHGNVAVLKLLLEAGADVNAATDAGYTALMATAFDPATDCCAVLVEAGADIDACNKDGMTVLDLARLNSQHCHVDILETVARWRARRPWLSVVMLKH